MNNLKQIINEIMPGLNINKQQLIIQFLQDPDLKHFIITNKLSEPTLMVSLNQFYQYTQEKNNCNNCTSLETCSNLLTGHYTLLNYINGQIQTSLHKCDKLRKKEEEEYRKQLFRSQYVPREVLKATFKNIDKKAQTSERELALAALLDFCKNFNTNEPQKGIYLYGPLGVGKSYLMAAAANKLAEMGVSVLMVYVPDFFREMKNSIQDQSLNEKIDVLKNVQVLILDDLGAETISQWERDEILGAILQGRMIKGLPTLYTTNFDYNGLEEHLSYSNKGGEEGLKARRLMERIRHYTVPYFVDGPNRRMN